MRRIERFKLVGSISVELQNRMTFADIDPFLRSFGIEPGDTRSYNSKRVYVKDQLSDVPDEVVIRIADELELDHAYVVAPEGVAQSRFWEPNHFRLFLSHVSAFKQQTGALQQALRGYGISAFVAHVDIEPTKPWQAEIEVALASMDALAALLTEGFKQSNWTDQEVGFAVARGVLVIPVIRDLDPYGFIGKSQGFIARNKTVPQVAWAIFDILVQAEKTRSKMLVALVDTTLSAESDGDALQRLAILESLREVPPAFVKRLRDGAFTSKLFRPKSELWEAANRFLAARGQEALVEAVPAGSIFDVSDDDLPF